MTRPLDYATPRPRAIGLSVAQRVLAAMLPLGAATALAVAVLVDRHFVCCRHPIVWMWCVTLPCLAAGGIWAVDAGRRRGAGQAASAAAALASLGINATCVLLILVHRD